MRFLFPLLLFCSTALGQGFMSYQVPDLSGLPSSDIQRDLTGVAYLWVASDIQTNSAVSGNWLDRIQGAAMLQGNSANQPTNQGGTNIWIDATHWLTNVPTTTGSNMAFGFIFKMIDPTGAGGTFPAILSEGNESVCVANSLQIGLDSGSSYKLRNSPFCDSTTFMGNNFGSLTNVYCDMVFSQWRTNTLDITGRACYTNGALSAKFASSAGGSGVFFGSAAANPNTPKFFGHNQFRNSGPSFWIAEYWIWTNGPPAAENGVDISATALANFHKFATNHYGFTP